MRALLVSIFLLSPALADADEFYYLGMGPENEIRLTVDSAKHQCTLRAVGGHLVTDDPTCQTTLADGIKISLGSLRISFTEEDLLNAPFEYKEDLEFFKIERLDSFSILGSTFDNIFLIDHAVGIPENLEHHRVVFSREHGIISFYRSTFTTENGSADSHYFMKGACGIAGDCNDEN